MLFFPKIDNIGWCAPETETHKSINLPIKQVNTITIRHDSVFLGSLLSFEYMCFRTRSVAAEAADASTRAIWKFIPPSVAL